MFSQVKDLGHPYHQPMTQQTTKSILQNKWNRARYKYPQSQFGKRLLRYNVEWERQYPWLRYSPSEDAAYCCVCILFNKQKGSNATFQREGFRDWKNAVGEKRGIISNHGNTPGHKAASELAENFLCVCKGQQKDIHSVISKTYSDKVQTNRNILSSILDIILNLGKRNVALRGNWDEEAHEEDGNFKHFVKWKSKFDDTLKLHLETTARNATYMSPSIQNELIACCGAEIQDKIVQKIKKSKYFSVLADETADVGGTEQLSICIRYVSEVFEIQEDFLGFCPLDKQDAASITHAILSQLEKWGLPVAFLRGQGYDGASTMSGRLGGVQQKIRELQPRALFTHCRSHALNLVVVHGCTDVPIVRNTMTMIEKIAVFFSASATKKNMLQDHVLQDQETESDGTRLHSEKASRLRNSIESFDTIVTAVTIHKVLGYILPLTTRLQSPDVDILSAYKEGREVAQVIESLRSEESFSTIYQQAVQMASTIDVAPVKKRVTVKQQHRGNAPADSVAEHYRLNLFLPFIDHVTEELRTRFAESSEPALVAALLVPKALPQLTEEKQNLLLSWYKEDLPQPDAAEQEIHRWKHHFKKYTGPLPETAKETLQNIDMGFYPNIQCILCIYLTLPVTTCSCERSFSALRRLKTWLRSSMGNERLSGLALIHVHRTMAVDPMKVLQRWDASGHRRIVTCFDKR
uniref:TTF-type domain-containing protein n=1 Tax=Myripristis murdjan TaxID=586833 RepID=A0A667WQR9_9TELE